MSDERLVEPRSAAERDDQRRAAERIASAMFDRLRELRFAPRNVDELAGVVDDALERAGVTPGVLEALRESVRDLDRAHRIRRERAIARALLMDEQVTPEEVEPWIDRVIARVDAELADPRASSEPSTELGSLTFSDRQEVEAIARSIVVASGARRARGRARARREDRGRGMNDGRCLACGETRPVFLTDVDRAGALGICEVCTSTAASAFRRERASSAELAPLQAADHSRACALLRALGVPVGPYPGIEPIAVRCDSDRERVRFVYQDAHAALECAVERAEFERWLDDLAQRIVSGPPPLERPS